MSATQDFQHQFFDMLMQSQYWPEEVMVAYQRSQLQQLLRHAKGLAVR
jgi:phenylacetate-CoA ligase